MKIKKLFCCTSKDTHSSCLPAAVLRKSDLDRIRERLSIKVLKNIEFIMNCTIEKCTHLFEYQLKKNKKLSKEYLDNSVNYKLQYFFSTSLLNKIVLVNVTSIISILELISPEQLRCNDIHNELIDKITNAFVYYLDCCFNQRATQTDLSKDNFNPTIPSDFDYKNNQGNLPGLQKYLEKSVVPFLKAKKLNIQSLKSAYTEGISNIHKLIKRDIQGISILYSEQIMHYLRYPLLHNLYSITRASI